MNKILMSTAAAVALALTLPAFAQKAPEKAVEKAVEKAADKAATTPAAATSTVQIPKNTFYKGLGPTQYLVKSRLIGQPVVDKNGAEVGKIEDVILGTKDDKIDGVIMGIGGFLGLAEKKIGVRIAALKFEAKDGKTVISMPVATKEMLAAIDGYDGQRTLVQKAGDAAKGAAKSASDAAKSAAEAAKNLVTKKDEAPAKK